MERQHGSALMLVTIFTIFVLLLNCIPEPAPSTSKRTAASATIKHSIDEITDDPQSTMTEFQKKQKIMDVIKNSCLPKLVCQLLASTDRKYSKSEISLLSIIRDTSLGVTGEVTSKLHFAAHMGQLVAGVDGAGCHNFYPECPLAGNSILPILANSRSKGLGSSSN